MRKITCQDVENALIVYLMRKLGLSHVTLSDETIAALFPAADGISVQRDTVIKNWTFIITERK